ncbi:hypothetical protein FA13DRAFT_1809505 [Coprinellus micaceus]|uniref:F-box domain-containing protein n=1 Tax=Coprinellus micaceus TaxID=71717 RepID=A0A4Y7TVQ6_COPMI|nr:hypothetical protein FA13DRAFT_1809505 [Coprinellus micaceus]
MSEDITRIIFEILVEEDRRRPTYALLSRQVQRWVEPVIYREVVPDLWRGRFHRSVTALVSTKPPNFFALHVKTLFFKVHYPDPDDKRAAEILERCSGVLSLAVWSYVSEPDALLEPLPHLQKALQLPSLSPARLSLSQIVLSSNTPMNRAFSHPIFTHHLDITCTQEQGIWFSPSLVQLSNLTHLSVDVQIEGLDPTNVATDVIRDSPENLQVLLIWPSADTFTSKCRDGMQALVRGEVDTRAVLGFLRDPDAPTGPAANFEVTSEDFLGEWSNPSKGGALWASAERVIEKRQEKLVEVQSRNCADTAK